MSKKQVIKHSAAIQISNEVNILQRRAWNVLLANAFDDLAQKDIYEIALKDLARILRFESKNDKYLKDALKALNKTQVEWNILGKDGNEWGVTTLLAEAKIINGTCAYAYSPTLRQRLHNPEMYAKISLSLQNQFKSKHSLALYELFVDYFNIKMAYGETPQLSVEDFRKLLGLNDDEYKEFRDLNKFVIKKAVGEINKISDLIVEVEYQREGRKVAALKFRIKKNPKKENIIDFDRIEKKIDQGKREQLLIPEFNIANQELFNTLRDEFGISYGKAIEIIKTQDEFYLEEVLGTVREQIELDKVKDVPAFTVTAIEKDYRNKKNKYERKKERRAELENKIQEEKALLEKLQQEFERDSQAEIEKIMNQLPEDEKNRLQKDFEANSDDFTKKRLREKGFDCVKTSFACFVAGKYLSEEVLHFESYAEKKGYKVVKGLKGEYEFLKK